MATTKTKHKKTAAPGRKTGKTVLRRHVKAKKATARGSSTMAKRKMSSMRRPSTVKAKGKSTKAAVLKKKTLKTASKVKKIIKAARPLKKIMKAARPVLKKAPIKKAVARQIVKKTVQAKAAAPKMVKPAVEKAKIQPKPKPVKAPVAKKAPRQAATIHKFVPRPAGTMPAMTAKAPVQPPMQMSKFSTTATPVKSAGNSKIGYRVGEHVVYPTHGVGQITAIEEQIIAGLKLELFVVFFAKDRMTLRVPVGKIASVGMRKISEAGFVTRAMETLKGRPRIKRTMWSRRAQEYEAKINSGDLISVAEVVRDLFRAETQPEQSYSERQLYEASLDRMMREIAVVNKVSDDDARHLIESTLKKAPRRRGSAQEGEDNVIAFAAKTADNDDGDASKEEAA